MKFKIVDLIALIIASLPFLYWMQFKDTIGDSIPVHWNIHGEVDRWESKEDVPGALAVTAGIGLVVYIILRLLKKLDPKRTAQLNEGTAEKVGIGIVAVMSAIGLVTFWAPAKGYDTTSGVFFIISLFFAFLGNVMYNIKPNYFIGLRLPWTLDNDENWRLTHRLAGVLWFFAGAVCAVMALLIKAQTMAPIFFIVAISLVIIPSVYSFVLFKKVKS